VKYRLRFLAAAEQDLKDAFDFLAPLAGEPTAQRHVEELLAACEGLRDFPLCGGSRDALRLGLRIISVNRRTTIAYAVSGEEVIILRFLGRGRDLGVAFGVADKVEESAGLRDG
jgi:toxin ParE1/3/4